MQLSKLFLSTLLLYTTTSFAEKASSSSSSSSSTTTTTLSHPTESSNDTSSIPNQNGTEEEEELNPHQASLDAISHEWTQICSLGCQPGTFPSDTYHLTHYLLPHLINIQYKPSCNAKSAHLKYFKEIVECSGRHDLCAEKLDKGTMKCRDKALRKVTTDLKHLGEGGMDCEREEDWQGEFYGSVLEGMRWFRREVCAPRELMKKGGGEMRNCRLMGTCMSPADEL